MDEDIRILERLTHILPGQTYSFTYGAMPRTSWATSIYKRYNGENRQTMIEGLTKLANDISRRHYQINDIRNKHLVDTIQCAIGGLQQLALNYQDDLETNAAINDITTQIILACDRINVEYVRNVDVIAVRKNPEEKDEITDHNSGSTVRSSLHGNLKRTQNRRRMSIRKVSFQQ